MKRLDLIAGQDEDGRTTLKCPGVGIWRQGPALGHLAIAGESLGVLSTLGREQALIVPAGVRGVIAQCPSGNDAPSVAFGDTLVVLGDALAATGLDSGDESATAAASEDGALVFRSSSSGRFYIRPAPDKPAFVAVGDEIEEGQTVFLLEVMKTFSRVAYGGPGLPTRARVVRITVADGDDLEAGQVVLELAQTES